MDPMPTTATVLTLDAPPAHTVNPTPDSTVTHTLAEAVSGDVVGTLERHVHATGRIVTHTVEIRPPGPRTGAAPIETDDPAVLADIAAVSMALADELLRLLS